MALFFSGTAAAESAKAPGAQEVERSALQTSAQPRNAASRGEGGKVGGIDSRSKDTWDQAGIGAEELRGHEAKPKVAFGVSSPEKKQMEKRISELKAAEDAGEFERPPASGGDGLVTPEREFQIAQEDIVAVPVEEVPYKRYVQIYKAAAKRYGLAKDWYVLAAVGKVESDHGRNVGPSSAGAMGPMQFLPSTWAQYGVDGNRDGEANIMDPEDAIPAAASYLKAGGAPDDWYAALYTYNRAGWYVRKVMGVAEAYKRQAGGENEGKP